LTGVERDSAAAGTRFHHFLVTTGHCVGGTKKLTLPSPNPISSNMPRASWTGRLNRGKLIYPVFKQKYSRRAVDESPEHSSSRSSSSLWHTDNFRIKSTSPIVHETMIMISEGFKHYKLESGMHQRSNRELLLLTMRLSFRSLARSP
jgi:hypothetical protein